MKTLPVVIKKNYEKLIQYATNLQYDDWMAIFENDEEDVDATMDQTGKHKALTLLTMFSIEELNEMLEDEEFDDEDLD